MGRWGTILSHAFLLVLKHFSLIASGGWCTRTSPWKNCNHLVHCICSVHQLGHKFIFHTHMRANLQYLRYLCLQRELRLLFISVEIQLLHVYCASFDSSLLFYSIPVYHIFFYFFFSYFLIFSVAVLYIYICILIGKLLSLFVLFVHKATKRDLSSCIYRSVFFVWFLAVCLMRECIVIIDTLPFYRCDFFFGKIISIQRN